MVNDQALQHERSSARRLRLLCYPMCLLLFKSGVRAWFWFQRAYHCAPVLQWQYTPVIELISDFCNVSLSATAKSEELVAAAPISVSALDRVRIRRCLYSPEPGTQRQ